MKQDLRSVPTPHPAATGTDATIPSTDGFSQFLLERLFIRLGQPVWFWPTVMTLIFALFVLGSSVAPDLELIA